MGKLAILISATGLVDQSLTDPQADADHIASVTTRTRRPAKPPCSKIHNRVVDVDRLEDSGSWFRTALLSSCPGETLIQASQQLKPTLEGFGLDEIFVR